MSEAAFERRIFWTILLMAVVVRLIAFDPYAGHHPDEAVQYLEQAHRRVFGYGLVPWEYRYGIRSWLMPLLLEGPMRLGEWLDPGGTLYLVLPRGMVAALNLVPVVAGWVIGRRISLQHAVIGMVAMALWVECVLFSVQTLTDSLAASCVIAAAALLRPGARTRWVVLAGALLALAVLLRFTLGPAVAIYGLMVAGRDWRMWAALALGGVPVVVAGGAIDALMGMAPYQWILTNYRMNIAEQRMLAIGGHSTWTYAKDVIFYWGLLVVVIPWLAASQWKRPDFRAMLIFAAVVIATHQLIGHKEYRYIWPAMQLLLLAASLGAVDLMRRWRGDVGGRKRIAPTATIAGVIVLASAAMALTPAYRQFWRDSGEPSRLAARAMADARVCGLAVPRREYYLFAYSLLHRDKPLFPLDTEEMPANLRDPGPAAGGFNAVLSWTDLPPPRGFPVRGECSGGGQERACVYYRPGNCSADAVSRSYRFQQTLERFDR